MAAICPNCKQPLQLEQIPLRRDIQMTCGACQAAVRVALVVTLESASTSGRGVPGGLNEKKVVTVVEGDASNEMIREVLATEGFEAVAVEDSQNIVAMVEKVRPGVILVDVGVPQILGFQIAGLLKKDNELKGVGVILLASIHDSTKYKREPDSLYGADDYIERHHIQDQLVPKIKRILETKRHSGAGTASTAKSGARWPEPPPPSSVHAAPSIQPEKAKAMEEAMSIERVFETMLEEERSAAAGKSAASESSKPSAKPRVAGDPAAHEAAKRLARIIISDIALYNQRAVEEGVRKGTFYELLREEIAEGKKLYEGRVPGEIVSGANYYQEAIEDFIKKRKMSLEK